VDGAGHVSGRDHLLGTALGIGEVVLFAGVAVWLVWRVECAARRVVDATAPEVVAAGDPENARSAQPTDHST
jgi:hypothetical protein